MCVTFCSYLEQLTKAGRLEGSRQEDRGMTQAAQLLLQGWAQICTWVDDTHCICHVPSQSDPTKKWSVNLVDATCDCPASSHEGRL